MIQNITSYLIAYFPFIFTIGIGSYTPGPNNIMLMQSCMLFGYKKTLPHILGVNTGYNILFILIAISITTLTENNPILMLIIKVVGTLYFIWFSYNIITMDVDTIYDRIHNIKTTHSNTHLLQEQNTPHTTHHIHIKKRIRPFTFFQYFLFQFINIKSIFILISAINMNKHTNKITPLFAMSVTVILISISATHCWSLLGVFLYKFIKHKKITKSINFILGTSLLWFCIRIWL